MPQMSPMWWTTLFLVFNIFMLFMNSMVYFNLTTSAKTPKAIKTANMQWKW